MKKILVGVLFLMLATAVSAQQSERWRLVINGTVGGDNAVALTEVEFSGYATYDIDSVVTGVGGSFTFGTPGVGDVTEHFPAGSFFTVSGSTGNDDQYKVGSSSYSSGTNKTTVTIDATVPGATDTHTNEILDGTADGSVTTDAKYDGTRSDFGTSVCTGVNSSGWTCDSAATNRKGTPSSALSGVPDNRQIKVVFDNNDSTSYETDEVINSTTLYYVQYHWYQGSSAIGRTLPDVTEYSITIPDGTELTTAPLTWEVEYWDGSRQRWRRADSQTGLGINWTTADDISVSGSVVGKKLTFTID